MSREYCPRCQTLHEPTLDCVWHRLCPPLYRSTDPARLPAGPLAAVRRWTFGPQGLLAVGPTGSGKTRACYLLLHDLHLAGVPLRTFDCAAFGHEVARRFRDGDGEAWADRLAAHRGVVFLDDLGKVPFTERVEAELFALVERRTSHRLPIIATTNASGSDLEDRLSTDRGAPLVRRLREFCEVVNFARNAVTE